MRRLQHFKGDMRLANECLFVGVVGMRSDQIPEHMVMEMVA